MATQPEQVISKIVEGRLHKFYEENVLMDQPFVKDPAKTVSELVTRRSPKPERRSPSAASHATRWVKVWSDARRLRH
jgi:translation elongation factor EF-Ts